MKKAFSFIILSLASVFCNATEWQACENYLFNSSGEANFVKLYLRNTQFSNFAVFADAKGEYTIATIKSSYWTCPACGTSNPDWSDSCQNSSCPFSWRR